MSYFKIEPEDSTFKMIFADVTHRCNMHCKNCYLPNRNIADMDIERLYQVLKRLPKSVDVRLIGAEPTMRDDIFDIISSVLKIGHRVSLVTNGLKLEDLNYCKELKKAGLKVINISMNGGSDDKLYSLIDGGSYAKQKVLALKNSLSLDFRVGTGTIISKNVNEAAIQNIVDTLIAVSTELGIVYPRKSYAPLIRFKNVGAIGRYQKDGLMSLDDLGQLVAKELGIDSHELRKNISARGTIYIKSAEQAKSEGYHIANEPRSFYWTLNTAVGPLYILINDWDVKETGIPDSDNYNRGRVTEDWLIAPFFEDVKQNEFGY